MAIDLVAAHDEFILLKTREQKRNQEYFESRQAVQGNFRWPRAWPAHIDKVTHNLCKPITERFATYLIGSGFSFNVDRPNSLDFRDKAERTEKILRRLLDLANSELQLDMGAKSGSQLGRTIFKVYEAGEGDAKHACFSYCQPDYFYGIPAGDNHLGEYSVVYYSYPLDINEAKRVFGPGPYKTEAEMSQANYYNPLPEDARNTFDRARQRRVPVVEYWTTDGYALEVGGVVKFNGDNPFKSKVTGKGYVPFVVIENIRNAGTGFGESDITQARGLNEQLNYLLSRKTHIVGRWLQPTLVWEGAPQNYADTLASTIGGGGAIPARIGSKLYFLAYDRPNPAVTEMEQTLRAAILDTTGMSEIALQGTVTGSVNTGPALAAQFAPVITTIAKKRKEWERGLKTLFRYLLDTQERIGASTALGQAVINQTTQSQQQPDGELVDLSGEDIGGLREVTLQWPEVLPKDDVEQAQFELAKLQAGVQSFYTTLEKLGEDYPDDEIARIREENTDPSLRGEKVAEQMRAQASAAGPMLKAQQQQFDQQQAMQGGPPGPVGAGAPPDPAAAAFPDQGGLPPEALQGGGPAPADMGERIRQLVRARAATQMDDEGTITHGSGR
ncbi:MAG: phage portal protein [Mycobacteriaceae bacterium]